MTECGRRVRWDSAPAPGGEPLSSSLPTGGAPAPLPLSVLSVTQHAAKDRSLPLGEAPVTLVGDANRSTGGVTYGGSRSPGAPDRRRAGRWESRLRAR